MGEQRADHGPGKGRNRKTRRGPRSTEKLSRLRALVCRLGQMCTRLAQFGQSASPEMSATVAACAKSALAVANELDPPSGEVAPAPRRRAARDRDEGITAAAHLEAVSRRILESAVLRKDPDLHFDLGLAFKELEEYEKAETHLRIATTRRLSNERAFQQLAICLGRLGRLEDALGILSDLDRDRPGSSETLGLLGRVHKDLWLRERKLHRPSRHHLQRAVRFYEAGFRKNPTDYYPGVNAVTLRSFLSDARTRQPSPALASKVLAACRDHTRFDTDDFWAWAAEGEVHIARDRFDEALRAYERALECRDTPFMRTSALRQLMLIRDERKLGAQIDPIIQLLQAPSQPHEISRRSVRWLASEYSQHRRRARSVTVEPYDLGQRIVPALGISADLLFVRANERTLRVALLDITGKGPGAAMLAHFAEGILESARPGETPKATMERLNNALEGVSCADHDRRVAGTGALIDVTLGTGRVRYVRAGLPEFVVFDCETGNHRRRADGGPPLGITRDIEYPQGTLRLAPTEAMVLVSDGITEAAPPGGESGAEFGYEGILRELRRGKRKSAQELADDIVQAARDACGNRPDRDDMTVFVMKPRPPR